MRIRFSVLILFSIVSVFCANNIVAAKLNPKSNQYYRTKALVERYKLASSLYQKKGPKAFLDVWFSDKASEAKALMAKSINDLGALPKMTYLPSIEAIVLESKSFMLVVQWPDATNGNFLMNGVPVKMTGHVQIDSEETFKIVKASKKELKKVSLWQTLFLPLAFAEGTTPSPGTDSPEVYLAKINDWLAGFKSKFKARSEDASLSDAERKEAEKLTQTATSLSERLSRINKEEFQGQVAENIQGALGDTLLPDLNDPNSHSSAASALAKIDAGAPRDYDTRFEATYGYEGDVAKGTGGAAVFSGPDGNLFKLLKEKVSSTESNSKGQSFRSLYLDNPTNDFLTEVCQNFKTLTDDEKATVWASFFDAVSFAESGHNPKDSYVEKDGNVSAGLFALSKTDTARGGLCSEIGAKLTDPETNTKCAVEIMSQIMGKYNVTFKDDSGKYWSVLSKSQNPTGLKRVKDRLAYLKSLSNDQGAALKKCG